MQKNAIVQECEKYKAQLEKSGTKYKILSENMILLEKCSKKIRRIYFFRRFVVKKCGQIKENRVRKQVKNPWEAERYAMHSSGKNFLVAELSPI